MVARTLRHAIYSNLVWISLVTVLLHLHLCNIVVIEVEFAKQTQTVSNIILSKIKTRHSCTSHSISFMLDFPPDFTVLHCSLHLLMQIALTFMFPQVIQLKALNINRVHLHQENVKSVSVWYLFACFSFPFVCVCEREKERDRDAH